MVGLNRVFHSDPSKTPKTATEATIMVRIRRSGERRMRSKCPTALDMPIFYTRRYGLGMAERPARSTLAWSRVDLDP